MPTELRFADGRICMVLLTGIGDVVHGLPVANALKDDDPSRYIAWVCEPAPAQVLEAHPSVDEVIVFRKSRGFRGVAELWRALGGRRFNLTLNLQRYFKSIAPTVLSGAPHRVGMDPAKVRDGVAFFCNHHLPPGPWRHTQDLFLEFLDFLGLPRPAPSWRITLTEAEQRERTEYFARIDRQPVVSVAVSSANPKKDWVPERYGHVVDALAADFGATVLLIGGPAARERAAAAAVMEAARTPPRWELGDSVRRLIGLIAGSDLVISPDTGPLHIAHALEVPVVGLYGHTNPWRTGPYLRYRDLIIDRYTNADEAPDPSRTEPRHGRMERIQVADVLDKVERRFRGYGRRGAAAGERAP
ncbi:MAG: glycosyltransferase family 9 protein [Gemmatimonadetes bacterium]|nr:glycosyltransferase family 9 protein [Gemmatimonadota bacterium]